MDATLLSLINNLNDKIKHLEQKINLLEDKLQTTHIKNRSYFVRLINKYPISEEMVLSDIPYFDLTPDMAYEYYQDEKNRFLFIDVSDKNYSPESSIKGRVHIPLDILDSKIEDLRDTSMPIMIISEDGTKSIIACHKMANAGFVYLHNISGGHSFWPGHKLSRKKK